MVNIIKLFSSIYPESLVWRRALSTSFAIFIAVLVDHYYSFLHQGWIPVVTILVTQLTLRSNLRQVLERAFFVFATILVLSCLMMLAQMTSFSRVFVVFGFIVSYLIYAASVRKGQIYSFSLLLVIIVLIMLIPFNFPSQIYNRMHDVVLGCLISVVTSLLIFPSRPEVDFRKGVGPILKAYSDYLTAITALLFKEKGAEENAMRTQRLVENVLQVHNPYFPGWVYDLGFNLELQQGHRHFLVKVERLGQVLFAMHQIARHAIDLPLLAHFREPMIHYVEKVRVLINLFVLRLELGKLTDGVENFGEELQQLEEMYRQVINVPLELLDSSQDYIDIAAYICDLKDFQKILLNLAEALR